MPGDKRGRLAAFTFHFIASIDRNVMLAMQNKTVKKIMAILKTRKTELDTNTIRWFITLRYQALQAQSTVPCSRCHAPAKHLNPIKTVTLRTQADFKGTLQRFLRMKFSLLITRSTIKPVKTAV